MATADTLAPTEERSRNRAAFNPGKFIGRTILYFIAIASSLMFMVPFFWALSNSLKEPGEMRLFPPVWIPATFQWQNYIEVFMLKPVGQWTQNTFTIALLAVLGTLISCSLAGYAFARFRFPGRNLMFILTLSVLMLPGELTMIPTYILYSKLPAFGIQEGKSWLNTYLPLIVPSFFGAAGGPTFIFLLRQFFMTIPLELDEAAKIDGASYFTIFWRIILPLSRPVLATVAIISFIGQWNSFILPLIILNDEIRFPLSLGLRAFQMNPDNARPTEHLLMAAAVMMTLPCVLLFFTAQRYFVRGIVMSGIKG